MNDNRFIILENEELEQKAGVPICGGNLSTPVIDTSNFIHEIHYQIGNKLYIENAYQLKKLKKEEFERDIELENIVGNLLIAEYQVDKLRDRVVDKLGARYGHGEDKKMSTYIFKNNGRWVKVSIKVEEITIDKTKDIQEMQ